MMRDNFLLEFANLKPKDTGLSEGTIYVSTKQGTHGPRIKYFRKTPSPKWCASIEITNDDIITIYRN